MSSPIKTKLCTKYLNGNCPYGEKCTFAHDQSELRRGNCKFFAQGNCRFGDECQFEHVKTESTNEEFINYQQLKKTYIEPVFLNLNNASDDDDFKKIGEQLISQIVCEAKNE